MVETLIENHFKFYLKDESVDKKFFASLDVLKYHRFAEKIESGDSKRKNVLQAEVFRSLWDEANRFRAPRSRSYLSSYRQHLEVSPNKKYHIVTLQCSRMCDCNATQSFCEFDKTLQKRSKDQPRRYYR